jgi:hypothetical protein
VRLLRPYYSKRTGPRIFILAVGKKVAKRRAVGEPWISLDPTIEVTGDYDNGELSFLSADWSIYYPPIIGVSLNARKKARQRWVRARRAEGRWK